jgi:hypothetical protein
MTPASSLALSPADFILMTALSRLAVKEVSVSTTPGGEKMQ